MLKVIGVLFIILGPLALRTETQGLGRPLAPINIQAALSITPAPTASPGSNQPGGGIVVGHSSRNDTSLPLREIPPVPLRPQPEHEANPNPEISTAQMNAPDPVVQSSLGPLTMPTATLNFDGIPFPGVSCNCAPPDPNGEVGATQYVQIVNEGYQVFNKTTGASLLGPVDIATIWSGFGGVCENDGNGDPVVLYDQLANRWLVSQFAGTTVPTDECVAVSTTSDATGAYHRYDFHLGSNFFDYPKLSVWPDAYYLGEHVFDTAGTTELGPQPFALDRAAMLAGNPATFVTTGSPLSPSLGFMLPGDLDGSILPPAGAPNPWLSTASATWSLYRFHVDFVTPLSSTFTLAGHLTPAGFTSLCTGTRSCVPQLGTSDGLDGIGDRPMFRLAYRRFDNGHEALVGNRTVSSGGVAAIRWWEITNATSGTPAFVQQSTYQPDSTWRWLGSIAMDAQGNLALGFSASSSSIHPQIRYAGRLATDPLNTLSQGEATLFAGTGSQTGTNNRWGDYSDLTVDPVDDCTFWYTNEYLATTGSFNWRTRIGSFKFPSCTRGSDFGVSAMPVTQTICAPADAVYTVTVDSVSGFNNPVTLNTSGRPAGTAASFSINPVIPPNISTLTIGSTGAASAGSYHIDVIGVSTTRTHTTTVGLDLFSAAPGASTLVTPTNGALSVTVQPTFTWTAIDQAGSYILEIATDAGFTNIVHSATGLNGTSYNGASLNTSTTYYWRVRAVNACGEGVNSAIFSFTTAAGPGDCGPGTTPNILYSNDFEADAAGWTHSATTGTDTWVLTTTNPHSGVQSWHANDPGSVSDQRLVSPAIILPSGQNPIALKFWNWQSMETRTGGCYDGGILEATTNGGISWTQIISPNLLTDPYDGPIASSFGNPLAGLKAWCGNNPQPYLNSIVDVSAYAGQTAQFRFRLGSDSSVSKPGWNIDDVVVQSCRANAAPSFVNVNVNPASIDENGVITLTGTFTDPNGLDTHMLAFDWGDGTPTQTLPALNAGVYAFTVTHQYLDDNPTGTPSDINTIDVTLTDSLSHTVVTSTHVVVNNVPPIVDAGPDRTAQVNTAIQFNGSYIDPGTLDTHTIQWDLGDGSTLTGTLSAQHTYTATGIYTVTLTVTDDDSGVGTDWLVAEILPWRFYLPVILEND